MSLFKWGMTRLHSGEISSFKIDCDALTDDDWDALACMIADHVGMFSVVRGIPRGGLKLAEKLQGLKWRTGPVLIVDDVLTTGGSMEAARAEAAEAYPGWDIKGAVIFARRPTPDWIMALFTLRQ